jgi:hypothetical protein
MKHATKLFAAFAIVATAAALLLAACKKEVPASVPVVRITVQPAAPAAQTEGSIDGILAVTASVTEGATLTYQWYSNTSASNTGGTAISGATSAGYTLPATLAAGKHYYFCEVGAKGAEAVRTTAVTVTVAEAEPVPVISIDTQPSAPAPLTEGNIPADTKLTVTASVTEGATLKYQWYTYDKANNELFEPIAGATGASYTLPADLTVGEHWYVCEVSAGEAVSKLTDPVAVAVEAAAIVQVPAGPIQGLVSPEAGAVYTAPTLPIAREHYTIRSVTYGIEDGETFDYDKVYLLDVTLQAAAGYTFAGYDTAAAAGFTVNGVAPADAGVLWEGEALRMVYAMPSTIYRSTDFSQDGTVVKLQTATKGAGINIVLMGDGYVDRDMGAGGIYETLMNDLHNHLFDLEPMRTYREYFNVYMIKVVSPDKRFPDGEPTTLTKIWGPRTVDPEKCDPYLSNASLDPDKTYVNVIINEAGTGGNCLSEGNGALAYALMYNASGGGNRDALHHELTGHGIGLLLDEYVVMNGTVTDDYKQLVAHMHNDGRYLNVSNSSDPAQVPWAHLIGHPKYPYVGVYEGAYYEYGMWRSEPKSLMMSAGNIYFNAVSRELIVKNIMRIAGEPYSFDEFVRLDVNENY